MISSNTNAMEFIYDIHIMFLWDIRKFAVTALFVFKHFSYTATCT